MVLFLHPTRIWGKSRPSNTGIGGMSATSQSSTWNENYQPIVNRAEAWLYGKQVCFAKLPLHSAAWHSEIRPAGSGRLGQKKRIYRQNQILKVAESDTHTPSGGRRSLCAPVISSCSPGAPFPCCLPWSTLHCCRLHRGYTNTPGEGAREGTNEGIRASERIETDP